MYLMPKGEYIEKFPYNLLSGKALKVYKKLGSYIKEESLWLEPF